MRPTLSRRIYVLAAVLALCVGMSLTTSSASAQPLTPGAFTGQGHAQVKSAGPFSPGGYDVVVGNTNTCGDNMDEPCAYTELHVRTPWDFDTPDAMTYVSVGLKTVAGTRVPTQSASFEYGASALDSYANGYIGTQTNAPLPAGVYVASAYFHQAGYWSCSIYNPDGCSWSPEESWSALWKFRWDGSTKVIRPIYHTPMTSVTAASFKRHGSRVTATGVVRARLVNQSDFSLAAYRPLKGAHVQLFTKKSGRWIYLKQAVTDARGRYSFSIKQRSRQYFAVLVVGTATYPSRTLVSAAKR